MIPCVCSHSVHSSPLTLTEREAQNLWLLEQLQSVVC